MATPSLADLQIREATPADVHALSELAKRTWSDAFGGSVSPDDEAVELEETRSETYFIGTLKEKTILVAERSDTLVGYVQSATWTSRSSKSGREIRSCIASMSRRSCRGEVWVGGS